MVAIFLIYALWSNSTIAFATNSPGTTNRIQPPSNIDWNSFEDIIEIPPLESRPSPIEQSQSDETNKRKQSPNFMSIREKKVKDDHNKLKMGFGKPYQRMLTKMEKDPEYAEKKRKQRVGATRKYRNQSKIIFMSEEKKKEERNERSRQYYRQRKERLGAYGNAKARKIQEIRKKIKFDKASSEELQMFHEYREKANEATRKHYHKIKNAGQ